MNRAAYLDRKAAAAFLTELGFPIHAATLATMERRGDGPPMIRAGGSIGYLRSALLAWAMARPSDAWRPGPAPKESP